MMTTTTVMLSPRLSEITEALRHAAVVAEVVAENAVQDAAGAFRLYHAVVVAEAAAEVVAEASQALAKVLSPRLHVLHQAARRRLFRCFLVNLRFQAQSRRRLMLLRYQRRLTLP
jgi:hypothetical protein